MINACERDVKLSRKMHVANFEKLEIDESCWTQLKKELAQVLIAANVPMSRLEFLFESACYDSDQDMCESRPDDDEIFMKLTSHLPLCGCLSIRKNPFSKIRVVFGQDESIHQPHLLRRSFWTFEDHVRRMNKTEDLGTMVSMLTVRKFYFSFHLPKHDAAEVLNDANKIIKGTKHANSDAAVALCGSDEKKDLTSTPFYRDFDYGKNRQGY